MRPIWYLDLFDSIFFNNLQPIFMNKFSFILLALGALLLSCKTQTIKETTDPVLQASQFYTPDSTWYDDTYMTFAYTDNINCFGSFMFGNESMNEQAMMFPEYFLAILGSE